VVTWEGAWDEPVPPQVCTLPVGITLGDDPPPGLLGVDDCNRRNSSGTLITTNQLDLAAEDEEAKRIEMLHVLDSTDYIMVGTNRRYDSQSRNPARWPMTNHYYDALFSGELGFDLVATFQETFELGPLRVSDQYLPTYDAPEWLNEFESEEAFSVYDHPVVFVFRKSADYDPQQAQDMLYNVPLTRVYEAPVFNNCPEDPDLYYCDPTLVNVATMSTEQASQAPTMLWLTDEMRDMQYSNGTWSARFDSSSQVNTNDVVSVAAWWIVIVLCGLAAWPLLFTLMPALADRGYAFAKFMGMFLVGWATWYLASVRIPVWSQAGILGGLIILFVFGLILLWRVRGEFIEYLRKHWGRLVVIEAITLAAFLFFLSIRLMNPELWHDSFGGEKPMNFAYFNAVLRSTIFPPYDPWYAGGFLNYYYFGYVIVGVPTLLLKIMPSIAYNLILPTLYATAGIGAFSVAFSIVNTLRERLRDGTLRRLGNPYIAGVAALVLAMVLGNLDTPRVALTGLANLGGYTRMDSLEEFLVEDYTRENGVPPSDAALLDIAQRARENRLGDRLSYEAKTAGDILNALGRGFVALFNQSELRVSADRWFWGPSRVLSEQPVDSGGAITEMPFFTFIYGDMHAHMISMPMQFFVFAFVLNEVLLAKDDRRRWIRWLALALGAITIGMLRATNTWDWITYLILSATALAYVWWLSWTAVAGDKATPADDVVLGTSQALGMIGVPTAARWGILGVWSVGRRRLSRWSLIDFVLRVGGFVAISFVAVLPFTTWFSSSYNRVLPWQGNRTPIWAYLDVHGLFLFLIFSLLVWETGRWLRSVTVKTLRGKFELVLALVLVVVGLIFAAVILSAMSYQVTLIAVPLLVWTAVLFFRQGQSRVMQYVLALTGLALGLTLGVEYVVLDGDIGRQNTVFKFYMQVWLMLSVVGGAVFAWLVHSLWRWKPGVRAAWSVTLAFLVTIALLFPIMASRGKAVYRMPPIPNEDGTTPPIPFTIDGASFMKWARRWEGDNDVLDLTQFSGFSLDEDYDMIRWLQENIQGTPTIIEGLGDDTQYRWNGRISIYTGLPAVLGWNFHQRQQRTLDPMGRLVEMRNSNVNAFYETHSIGTAWQILQFYNVDYIIVGKMERAYYNREGLAKFDQMADDGMLEVVWHEGDSIVYRVNHDAQLAERG
jgi:YYY domain-containing protein